MEAVDAEPEVGAAAVMYWYLSVGPLGEEDNTPHRH